MRYLILVSVFICFGASIVSACECPVGTHRQNFRRAENIFAGEVISVGANEISNPKIGSRPLHEITLRIEKRWKGSKNKTITILTDSCASMCCRVQFFEGRKYLVYVYKDSFVPSDCAWSAEFSSNQAQDNIKDLNSFWFRSKANFWIF